MLLSRLYNIFIYCTRATQLMSASSVGSTASVGYHGQVFNLEAALDETVRKLQAHLNLVQCALRSLAAMADQDCEFRLEVAESDKLDDELGSMNWLFSDLGSFSEDLVSIPDTADDKIWYKAHKAQRKLDDKRIEAEHTAIMKEERKVGKAALKMAQSSIAEGDEMDSEMKY